MTEDFDEKYERIHAEIQENSKLVRAIFQSAREDLPKKIESYRGRKLYFPTGLIYNGIYLGVDFKDIRKSIFPEILARMRLLYEESNGEIDLLNVFALLMPSGLEVECRGSCLGILSEDLSDNENRCLADTDYNGSHSKLLVKVFGEDDFIDKCVFRIGGLIQKGRNPQGILPNEVTRRVAADLDHLFGVSPEYRERFEAYQDQYEHDGRFMIHEV